MKPKWQVAGARLIFPAALFCVVCAGNGSQAPILFNKNFEGGALGKIEVLGENRFRCHVEGQCDERGRNRQANWYFFRMDNVRGQKITVILTDFVGEYNDRPGACAMNAKTVPVYSDDGETWHHFPSMDWDNTTKEAALEFTPTADSIWIAHVPPYTHTRLLRLLEDIERADCATVEVIGRTVQGRELHLVTVTDVREPDTQKKLVWLQARQHGWETGTSFVMEGALRFITSADPKAAELRRRLIFKFVPMADPDGCATGKVRFNANGFDLNRHWDEVDLRTRHFLHDMPEIWYLKKAILNCAGAGPEFALMLNLHNTETAEYLETCAGEGSAFETMRRFYALLVEHTSFEPGQELQVSKNPERTTNSLFQERKIPVCLMEQRISAGTKLGRQPTTAARLNFGGELVVAMAEAVLSAGERSAKREPH